MSTKKLLATALGVVAGAALLASPAAATPATPATPADSDCSAYDATGSGVIRPGYESYPWGYFWSEGAETFSFCVDVSDGAEVLLEVREFDINRQDWVTVATAPAGPGDKKFAYHTDKAWTYRLYVTGIGGSGTYTAGVDFSRFD